MNTLKPVYNSHFRDQPKEIVYRGGCYTERHVNGFKYTWVPEKEVTFLSRWTVATYNKMTYHYSLVV